jgi:hypothetical protein
MSGKSGIDSLLQSSSRKSRTCRTARARSSGVVMPHRRSERGSMQWAMDTSPLRVRRKLRRRNATAPSRREGAPNLGMHYVVTRINDSAASCRAVARHASGVCDARRRAAGATRSGPSTAPPIVVSAPCPHRGAEYRGGPRHLMRADGEHQPLLGWRAPRRLRAHSGATSSRFNRLRPFGNLIVPARPSVPTPLKSPAARDCACLRTLRERLQERQ